MMTSKALKIINHVIRELRATPQTSGVSGVATEYWADQLELAIELDEAGEAKAAVR